MGKDKNPRRVADNEAMAATRMLGVSRKMNLVAQTVRGKRVTRPLRTSLSPASVSQQT